MRWFNKSFFDKFYEKGKNGRKFINKKSLVSEEINNKFNLLKQLLMNEVHGKLLMPENEFKELVDEIIDFVSFPNFEMIDVVYKYPSIKYSFYFYDNDNEVKYESSFYINEGYKSHDRSKKIHYVSDNEFNLLNLNIFNFYNQMTSFIEKEFAFYVKKISLLPYAYVENFRYNKEDELKLYPLKTHEYQYSNYLYINLNKPYFKNNNTIDCIESLNEMYKNLLAIKTVYKNLDDVIMYEDDLDIFMESDKMNDFFIRESECEEEEIKEELPYFENEEEEEEYFYYYEPEIIIHEWFVWRT